MVLPVRRGTPLDYRVFVASTVTGEIVGDIPIVGNPTWTVGLNSYGGLSFTVPIGETSGALSREDFRYLGTPWRWSWGISLGDKILQAGPIVGHQFTDVTGPPAVRVQCTGMLGFLATKRLAIGSEWIPGLDVASEYGDFMTEGSWSDAQRIYFLIDNDQERAGHTLPIQLDFPSAFTSPTSEEIYHGYDLASVGQRITQLTQRNSTPEVEFRPQYSSSARESIFWEARIGGEERLGNLTFEHPLDYGSSLVSIDYEVDGSQQTTAHFERGNGTERLLLTAFADNDLLPGADTHPWPVLETVSSEHSSVTNSETLQNWANAYVESNSFPIETWSAVIRVDGTNGQGKTTRAPRLVEMQVGDNLMCRVEGHRLIPDGYYPHRIIGMTNGPSLYEAKLILQPTQQVF